MSCDLSWDAHLNTISKKAYQTLGLLLGTISSGSVRTRKLLYLTLVPSQVIYCSQVWHPHLIKNITQLEKLQRFATMFILSDYSSDYKSRLIDLQTLPLLMYFELSDITFFSHFLPPNLTPLIYSTTCPLLLAPLKQQILTN